MPEDSSPTPIEVYKQIIDQMVERSPSMHARLVSEQGIYSKAPAHQPLNEFVRGLTHEQRSLLADILMHERSSAIHDVLAAITWWIDCREVGLTFRGEQMPVQLSGMGLHGDYVGRMDNWNWPKDDGKA